MTLLKFLFNYSKQIISKALNPKLIKAFGIYYLIFVVTFYLLRSFSSSSVLLWIIFAVLFRIASTIYKTIFIENIRLENLDKRPVIKNKKQLLFKSWIVFRNSLISDFLIILGLILFIYPGILLAKRYQYVDVISEDLLLGPKKSLKLSKEISKNRGWKIFFSNILISIIATLPIYIFLIFNNLIFQIFFAFYAQWIIYSVDVFVIMPNYKKFNIVG